MVLLPKGVNERLQDLLDRQDRGEELTPAERMEAEGVISGANHVGKREVLPPG